MPAGNAISAGILTGYQPVHCEERDASDARAGMPELRTAAIPGRDKLDSRGGTVPIIHHAIDHILEV